MSDRWKDDLSLVEKEALQNLIERIGPESAARIAAALTASARGPSGKPETAAMLRMAQIKLNDRTRGNFSIAAEVAKSPGFRSNMIELENFTKRLNRMFNEQEFKWTLLAKKLSVDHQVPSASNRKSSPAESRALARLVDVMDAELNFYGTILADAERLGPKHVDQVRNLGRKVCEELIMKRLEEQQGTSPPRGFKPRTFYDLVFHHPDGAPLRGA